MEVSSSKRRHNTPNFNIFENVETPYTNRPRRQISIYLVQDGGPISTLRNLSALSTALAEDCKAIAPQIQNSTPNRSIASQTQCTASTTITSISHSVRSRKTSSCWFSSAFQFVDWTSCSARSKNSVPILIRVTLITKMEGDRKIGMPKIKFKFNMIVSQKTLINTFIDFLNY